MSGFTDLEQQIIKYGFFRQQKRMEEAEESFQKIRATINASRPEAQATNSTQYNQGAVMIKPTVGRVVWYHPHSSDLIVHNAGEPLAGVVAKVWSDTCVNLAVFDANGVSKNYTSVFLYQGEGDRPASAYAEWMPYQKGQAAKTEALEAKLAG